MDQDYVNAEVAAQLAADCENAHHFDQEFLPEVGEFGPEFVDEYVDQYACENGPELGPDDVNGGFDPVPVCEEDEDQDQDPDQDQDQDQDDGGSSGDFDGFGYPVGDKSTYPAGGWKVWQVVGHYWSEYGGRHLAQDIARKEGGKATINAPVYSVADGVVRYAAMRDSQYKGTVMIEHDDGKGGKVCSFYAHMNSPLVEEGQTIKRGEQIGTVRDWAKCAKNGGKSTNTHLHYSIISEEVCEQSLDGNGAMCSYDTGGKNSIDSIDDEPAAYTPIKDKCGHYKHGAGIYSPTQFIEDNHY